jgi:hypothetical protein
VVPTITFEQLVAFLVLGHGRRQLLWFAVTRHPTAEWLAQQITEAFPWDSAPTYLARDNDRAFGSVFKRRIRAMGIRDRPTSFRSPWQNGHVERLIGIDTTRVHRSSDRAQRGASSADSCELLTYYRASPPIIMNGVLMFHFGRMLLTGTRSSASETSPHMQYWADYITGTHESNS